MIKLIQLKLSKVKYSGNSIGDDIRVEIEISNQFLRVDKIIKVGTVAEINKEIGRFEVDQKLFEANIRITVIEKDLLFNDVGSIDEKIKIDTNIIKSQQFIYKVSLKETRSVSGKFWGKTIANFEIILEVNITDAIWYIPDENDGWLMVRLKDDKAIISLPAYLNVKIERANNAREYFTILEGRYRGKLASVRFKEDGSSHLISNVQHESMVRASYSISRKTFTLNGKIYKTVDYKKALWRKGLYDIEIPDAPHRGGLNYTKIKRAKTWFRVGHTGDRYLHTGSRSLGCITIIETTRWIEIYNTLIKARKGDFMSIGVLEVID